MFGRLVFLAVLAISWISVETYKPEYKEEYIPDKDFLLKQKRIYDIYYHLTQPKLRPELYKEGQDYSIEANIDSYTNKEAVQEFLHRYEHGMLPHDSLLSVYYSRLGEETRAVFRLFYYAKDFDTFYKTALFCRNRLNHGLFTYAFTLAVIHRPDTKYIRIPAMYELGPYLFYNTELLEKTHHLKAFAKLETKHSAGYDTYILPYNYSSQYITDEYDYEQRLNYFTEDIGLNNYYFFFRSQYPFILSGQEFNWPKGIRGEEYLYGHKLLYNRYYLERLSNDLGMVEDYDFSRPFYAGYWPSMSYPNGMHFTSRPWNSQIPKSKIHKVMFSKEVETRLGQAIDSGIVFTSEGKMSKIWGPGGLDIVGNLIEGNADSSNKIYYGNLEKLHRNILGFAPSPPYKVHASALETFTACLRDPAFWRISKRLLHLYHDYKRNLGPYPAKEIQYPDLKIEAVEIDKLITYFDLFDSTISNGLAVENEQQAEAYRIQVRQHRLNHKPFSIKIDINAKEATKAVIRIFLGPKYNVHMKKMDFSEHYSEFYELDNFIWELNAGANKIDRHCHDFSFLEGDVEPSEVHFKKVIDAIGEIQPLKQRKYISGFPLRLLLPKGKPEGMPFQIFVHVAPIQGEPIQYSSRVFGESLIDSRSMGYPLDRPVRDFEFHGPNFFLKDVTIYHQSEHDHNVTF
ncbi:hypothetical protein QAD02_016205 [Eretmocerus hayati]|uniref:Uncharacterized protein n=1 Tax=Eretmocerus hayati TaxID=131215 RepID=A0ACC2PBF4_9HYME|nr:hypothetical protein QAD02_016205 [Eretmocerus hayati]